MVKSIRQANVTATRARILATAAQHFAQLGFAGARVDEIAAQAGVNKAALYYHVGDKESLYHAVLTGVLQEAADGVERAVNIGAAPEQNLRLFIAALADMLGAHPHLAPLILSEVGSGGMNLPDAALNHLLRLIAALRTVLEQGQERGVFRAVDPLMTHTLIVGGLLFYVAGAPIRARAATLGSGAVLRARQVPPQKAVEAVTDLILAGIIKAPPPGVPTPSAYASPRGIGPAAN